MQNLKLVEYLLDRIVMRLKAVTTDLPLQVDRPISFGAHDFCTDCENGATCCPPRAIPFGPPTDPPASIHHNPGYRKWYLDAEECLTLPCISTTG